MAINRQSFWSGLLGGVIGAGTMMLSGHAVSVSADTKQPTIPLIRTERLEIVSKTGKVVAYLEGSGESPILAMMDSNQFGTKERKVTLTAAALTLRSDSDRTIVSPDAGFMNQTEKGMLSLSSSFPLPTPTSEPSLTVLSKKGTAVLTSHGLQ